MDNPIKSLLESKWKTLKKSADAEVLWIAHQVTPAFPSTWPPAEGLQLIYYVYAYGNHSDVRRQIVDGHLISVPWACICKDMAPDSQPVVEFLLGELRSLGIQGFRPLSSDELAIYEQTARIEESLGRLTKGSSDRDYQALKVFYGTWLGLNGVIGEEIAKHHAGLFRWLELDS